MIEKFNLYTYPQGKYNLSKEYVLEKPSGWLTPCFDVEISNFNTIDELKNDIQSGWLKNKVVCTREFIIYNIKKNYYHIFEVYNNLYEEIEKFINICNKN